MITGKQKAQLLLSLIGEKSRDVLVRLSKGSANLLTTSVEDSPTLDPVSLNEFVQDVLNEIDRVKNESTDHSFLSMEDEHEEEVFSKEEEAELPEESLTFHEEPEILRDKTLRSPEKIASILAEQKIQIVSFFLSKISDETLREEILAELPDGLKDDIHTLQVDAIPISDDVYKNLFDYVCRKTPEELQEETSEDDDDIF